MKITDKILNKIAHSKRIKEILSPEFMTASGVSIDPDDADFRRISTGARDLEPLTREQTINNSYWLYESNQFFKRLINISIEAITSNGFSIDCVSPKCQEIIDDFWESPLTGFKDKFLDDDGLFREILLSGEGNWPVDENEIDGSIETGFLDTLAVTDVRMVAGNALIVDEIIYKKKNKDETLKVIRPIQGVLEGEVFHFAVNKPINSKRGRPWLTALIDWIDLNDQALFNELEGWNLKKLFVYDVTVEGANTREAIQKYMKEQNLLHGQVPKPGTVNVHNERVKWEAVSPNLNAADATEFARFFKQHIGSSAGYGPPMLGEGRSTNVGEAREIIKPTIWMIETHQRIIIKILTLIFSYVLQKAAEHGRATEEGIMTESDSREFTIKANQVLAREFIQEAKGFEGIVKSLAMSKEKGLMGDKLARRIMAFAITQIGFDVTEDQLEEEFEEQEKQNGTLSISPRGQIELFKPTQAELDLGGPVAEASLDFRKWWELREAVYRKKLTSKTQERAIDMLDNAETKRDLELIGELIDNGKK